MTLGHMMGKFKLIVLHEVGHSVHEDKPKELAEAFDNFVSMFHLKTKASELKIVTSLNGNKVVIQTNSQPSSPKKMSDSE
jgi:hypothetical protein